MALSVIQRPCVFTFAISSYFFFHLTIDNRLRNMTIVILCSQPTLRYESSMTNEITLLLDFVYDLLCCGENDAKLHHLNAVCCKLDLQLSAMRL
jgi:hypothetical protein